MDYEGPITFIDEHLNLTNHLSIKKIDIITVVYSCDLEEKNAHRNKDGMTDDDLEWMKSDCGIFQENNSTESDRTARNFLLWLCLPKNHDPIEYKDVIKLPVPIVQLPNDAGKLRVVVGNYSNQKGPIKADDLDFWDMRLKPGQTIVFNELKNQVVALFVISGDIVLEDGNKLSDAELGVFAQEGSSFTFTTTTYTKAVLLTGPPIDEPLMGYGQFDIKAIRKFRSEAP